MEKWQDWCVSTSPFQSGLLSVWIYHHCFTRWLGRPQIPACFILVKCSLVTLTLPALNKVPICCSNCRKKHFGGRDFGGFHCAVHVFTYQPIFLLHLGCHHPASTTINCNGSVLWCGPGWPRIMKSWGRLSKKGNIRGL